MFQITKHFAERAAQRGITERDIINCLTAGTKYKQNNLRTRYIAKDGNTCVAYAIEGRTVNLITCYKQESTA